MVKDMKNSVKKIDNKGFTLIELLAVVILLAIVMGVSGFAIVNIMSGYKNKNYDILVDEIYNAVGTYYQECKYMNNNCQYEITLGSLVRDGYLKGNHEDDSMKLVNPLDNVEINDCVIGFEYKNDKINIENKTSIDENGSCPNY